MTGRPSDRHAADLSTMQQTLLPHKGLPHQGRFASGPPARSVDDKRRHTIYGGDRYYHTLIDETAMATSTSLKLDDDLKGRVHQLAATRRRSAHWIMREAIAQYVEREEKREAFKQDALRAWSDYQANRLHLRAEEADAWLARLEAGEDVEPPDCHA